MYASVQIRRWHRVGNSTTLGDGGGDHKDSKASRPDDNMSRNNIARLWVCLTQMCIQVNDTVRHLTRDALTKVLGLLHGCGASNPPLEGPQQDYLCIECKTYICAHAQCTRLRFDSNSEYIIDDVERQTTADAHPLRIERVRIKSSVPQFVFVFYRAT